MNRPQGTTHRRHVLVVLMGAPTIVAALGLTALEPWRFQRPAEGLSLTLPETSLADARDDGQQVYEFIRAGQNPDRLMTVGYPALGDVQSARVPLLLWAVATGDSIPVDIVGLWCQY